MINQIVCWFVIAGVLIGWGLLISRLWTRCGITGTLGAFQILWVGLAAVVCALELISFVLPIQTAAVTLIVVPAAIGYGVARRSVARWLRSRARDRRDAAAIVAIVVAVLVVSIAAGGPVLLYDTGLYHEQAVKWMTHFPVVRGLGNLHMRFGYNNSIHLFGAFSDALWEGMAAHLATSFVALAVIAQCGVEILRARTPRARVRQAFCAVMLPYFVAELWTLDVSSLSSDVPLAAIAFVLVLELLTLNPRNVASLALVTSLAALAMVTKLGGLGFFVVVIAVAVWMLRGQPWRLRGVVLALPAMLVLGWLVRGVLLSGWIIYPVFGHLPLSWTVPERIASVDLGNIQSWSRIWGKPPAEVFGKGFWFWFGPWFEAFRTSRECVLALVALIFGIHRVGFARHRALSLVGERAALVCVVFALIHWFVGAPMLRYGGFLFWLLAAALVAPVVARALSQPHTRVVVLGFAIAFAMWAGAFAVRIPAPPKLWGRLPAPPHAPTSSANRPDRVWVPDSGDQCWDVPLPCTPTPNTSRALDPNRPSAGYEPSDEARSSR